jgi:peptide/nickel transport system ATP-binding protein
MTEPKERTADRTADWTDERGTSEEGKSPCQRERAADWTVKGEGGGGRGGERGTSDPSDEGSSVDSAPPAVQRSRAQSKQSPARLQVLELEIRSGRNGPAVVSGISFAVRPGAVLGLVGESGSGKTTVALALLGHTRRGLSVAGGEIRVDGTDLLRLKPAALRALRGAVVSYVPQDPAAALNPALRVGYQLREVLRVHPGRSADPDARIREVLREASLDAAPDLLRRYPHQLSGGQQQRIGLAMAFACRPALIVLDEPTTGLDVSTQRRVLDTVRQLCRGYGVAAVYVSHDLAVVSELADEVAVMYAGRIVETGPAGALFAGPRHPYTRGLLAAVPEPGGDRPLTGIPGQQPPPGRRGPGCAFAARCELVLEQCHHDEPELIPLSAGRTIPSPEAASPHPGTTTPSPRATIPSLHAVRCWRAAEVPAARPGLPRPRVAAGPGPAALLSVRGVSARYHGVPALSGIDLDLPARGCVAVVGESGSGKTTLARCITGLQQDWAGQVMLRGVPLARAARHRPKQVLQQIQYVFQNPYTSLNPRKTVGQIVAEPVQRFLGLPRGEQADRVVQVLEDVALGGSFLARYPDQLSGGERQRVAIARALAAEPDVLICDEVTSALDVSVQAVIVELLRAATAQRQLAMIFITHNLALVRNVAQTAVVLRQGQIVEAGPAEQILAAPASGYTAQLLADSPRLSRSARPAAQSGAQPEAGWPVSG